MVGSDEDGNDMVTAVLGSAPGPHFSHRLRRSLAALTVAAPLALASCGGSANTPPTTTRMPTTTVVSTTTVPVTTTASTTTAPPMTTTTVQATRTTTAPPPPSTYVTPSPYPTCAPPC